MKSEEELKNELEDLKKFERYRDNGVINLTTTQKNRIRRKIEFLEELLE